MILFAKHKNSNVMDKCYPEMEMDEKFQHYVHNVILSPKPPNFPPKTRYVRYDFINVQVKVGGKGQLKCD